MVFSKTLHLIDEGVSNLKSLLCEIVITLHIICAVSWNDDPMDQRCVITKRISIFHPSPIAIELYSVYNLVRSADS